MVSSLSTFQEYIYQGNISHVRFIVHLLNKLVLGFLDLRLRIARITTEPNRLRQGG